MKNSDEKQWTINNLYPYLTPLGLLFLLCTSNQQKKPHILVENHPMYIPTKFGFNWPSCFREED